jgi:hypothetical protein
MEISILGHKMRLELILVCLLVGGFIGVNMFCSCAGGVKEGFQAGTQLVGSTLSYTMGTGVKGSWETEDSASSGYNSWFQGLEGNTQGDHVPLAEGQLAMFPNNRSGPDCCPATYTNSVGCVCATPEQMKYLNERGGNRTLSSLY